jgi:pimeloyl-ACP methyl ester carboxylesterase
VTTRQIEVAGGRVVMLDDVGRPDGVPVLYLHGTPDSRLARPADDGLAADAGVRVLALDRPGYGGSDPMPTVGSGAGTSPGGWVEAVVGDGVAVLDELRVERCGVVAWSGGALTALAVAAGLPERIAALGIVAGLVPRQAYHDPAVREAGGDRLATLGLAEVLPPGELGEAVAPLVAPYPCDRRLALEHQAEHRDTAGALELATVPGGVERMADALVEAVRRGLAGAAADIEAQARPLAADLGSIACPVRLWYGTDDVVTPPAFGRWYAERLAGATLELVDGAAHYLLFTRWTDILRTIAAAADS